MVGSEHSRALIIVIAALAVCAGLVAGCGNSQTESAAPIPGPTGGAPKVAATGPAISGPVGFDQVALESSVKKVKSKDSLVFLHFSYADSDGKIYKCELPEAMSKGEYAPEEWVRTFNIYRLPAVIGQKKTAKKTGPAEIGDFPFVSPKPQKAEPARQPGTPTAQPAPMPMPNLPPMPSPQAQPMAPRPMPSVTPRGPEAVVPG